MFELIRDEVGSVGLGGMKSDLKDLLGDGGEEVDG